MKSLVDLCSVLLTQDVIGWSVVCVSSSDFHLLICALRLFLRLHQRMLYRIYLSTNPSPHDPQNVLLAQTNRPMKTLGRIFFDNPFRPIRFNVVVYRI